MEQLIVNGVAYNATPAEAAAAQQSEELAGNVEKMQINGQVYDIRDVEDVEALDRAKLTVTQVEWGDGKYLSNFLVGGTYHIRGTRTNVNDDLPMGEAGDNATIDAQLLVLESSIKSDDGSANRECITQVLSLSNRLAGSGDVYVRTGIGRNKGGVTFGAWRQLGAGGGSAAIEAQAPLAQENGKLFLNIGDGLRVENEELVAVPQSSSDTSNALRALFVAAGAEYNDTGVDIVRTTPWAGYVDNKDILNVSASDVKTIVQGGVTYKYVIDNGVYKVILTDLLGNIRHNEQYCIHRAGHYYLNGLGDITEQQMLTIYNNKIALDIILAGLEVSTRLLQDIATAPRTLLPPTGSLRRFDNKKIGGYYMVCAGVEVVDFAGGNWGTIYIPDINAGDPVFYNCDKLVAISPFKISKAMNLFFNCPALRYVAIKSNNSLNFKSSPYISKKSIIYAINNSTATAAVTITLHANAYARLANDADIVAALSNKPLVTLVSA